jgi:glycosyltransferase involved in cell wall biosynthesis
MSLPEHPGVIFTGFVDEQTKHDALAAATVFVQPSYFESFSLSLCEAWVEGRPALVQGRCDVLRGQVERSKGGLPYTGFAEFDAALAVLLASPALREQLGQAGREYVLANYEWDDVLDRYERLLRRVIGQRGQTNAAEIAPIRPSPALRHAFDRAR